MPCLLCYETSSPLLKLRRYGFHVSIEIWDVHFTSIFSIFCIMAGWIAEMLFMLFFAYIADIAEYKVYWLVGAPIINL